MLPDWSLCSAVGLVHKGIFTKSTLKHWHSGHSWAPYVCAPRSEEQNETVKGCDPVVLCVHCFTPLSRGDHNLKINFYDRHSATWSHLAASHLLILTLILRYYITGEWRSLKGNFIKKLNSFSSPFLFECEIHFHPCTSAMLFFLLRHTLTAH